ncbi:MAG: hypothetical protein IJQ13_05720 [Prevotella sp.]|nr:hypothetical protein [Prevotella sp.]
MSWEVNDEIALIITIGDSKVKRIAKVTTVNVDGSAVISMNIPAEVTTNSVELYYPASEVELSGSTYPFQSAGVIVKYTVKDLNNNSLDVSSLKLLFPPYNNINVTLTTPDDEVYVVMSTGASNVLHWFEATGSDGKKYVTKGTTPALYSGKYYRTTMKMATVGDVILTNGTFAAPTSTDAKAAMIAYIGSDADGSDNSDPSKWHGLAIALTDANSSNYCKWSDNTSENAGVSTSETKANHKAFLNGIKETQTLITKYGGSYAAAKAANYSVAGFTPVDYGYSGWFLPSSGQWMKFFEATGMNGVDSGDWGDYVSGGSANWTKVNTLMETAATGSSVKDNGNYWASSEQTEGNAATVGFYSTYGVRINNVNKNSNYNYVRSFLAF